MDEAEYYRGEGPTPSPALIKAALQEISGEEGWGGYRYYCAVLERCGCHPEEGACSALVTATEKARQLLAQEPKDRAALEVLLEKAGL